MDGGQDKGNSSGVEGGDSGRELQRGAQMSLGDLPALSAQLCSLLFVACPCLRCSGETLEIFGELFLRSNSW